MKKQFKDSSKRLVMNSVKVNSILNELNTGLNDIKEVTEADALQDDHVNHNNEIENENNQVG